MNDDTDPWGIVNGTSVEAAVEIAVKRPQFELRPCPPEWTSKGLGPQRVPDWVPGARRRSR